jgi:hypothetical protein
MNNPISIIENFLFGLCVRIVTILLQVPEMRTYPETTSKNTGKVSANSTIDCACCFLLIFLYWLMLPMPIRADQTRSNMDTPINVNSDVLEM